MARKRINKKGNLSDIAMIMVYIFVISIAILIVFKISDELNNEIQTNAAIGKLSGGADARAAMSDINGMYPGVVDNSMLFLTVGLAIVTLILAMMVVIHPVFFVFYIIMLGIVIFISGVFSNIYQEMAAQAALQSVADQLVFTTYIMTYLPFIVGIVGFLLSIVMYKVWQNNNY